jgi:chromosome segregation ATPase
MSSLVQKVKDKLHISKDKDDVGSATYNDGHSGTAKHGHTSTGATGATTTTTTTGATTTGANTAGATQGTTATTAGHGHSTTGTAATGTAGQVVETVTIHERDPNWGKARELTTAAEHQSKISAAKAYEAQSFLVSAQDAHKAAQEHVNAHSELAAQAEAEKRNIGTADYLHKELDHTKKVIEEKEHIHRELNKQLEGQKQIVQAKEGEFGSVAPLAAEKAKEAEALANKLNSIQGAKADLLNKHEQHVAFLNQLEAQKGQYAGNLQRLEGEADQLNRRALDLENQAKAARNAANERLAALKESQANARKIDTDADKYRRGLAAIEKDLEGYRVKESDLANKLAAAKAAAQQAADLAAAKQAELQLAKQQYDAERAKGIPIEQDIHRYHKSVQEKERELVEAQETSKAAKAAYEKFSAEANSHAKEIEKLLALKEEKFAGYQERKHDSDTANARANSMWEEAKKYGNTGDANALQRLAEAEKQFSEIQADVSRPLATPIVGAKQPTTQGATIHRSERAGEANEDTNKESIKNKYEYSV